MKEDHSMDSYYLKRIPPVRKLSPKQIKQIRLRDSLSIRYFAYCLNCHPNTIRRWEAGAARPSGIALKLLNVVDEKGLSILFLR